MGMGGLPWIVMGEVVPLRIRGPATSAATACMWAASYGVTAS